MLPAAPSADVYTDFQGLARLRGQAHTNSPETLRAAAQQFEAIFIQMMLKSMREASLGDDIFGSSAVDQYRSMFDQQLSLNLAKGRGIGLSDMLMQQLGGTTSTLPTETAFGNNPPDPFASRLFHGERTPLSIPHQMEKPDPYATHTTYTGSPAAAQAAMRFDDREDFIQKLWPHAQQAARALGIAPQFLLAQAALETGWGQAIAPTPQGSSHNLFGIKAHAGWDGPRASVSTLEYTNGVAVRRNDLFRVYPSPAESFADYVNFLQTNPRYAEALKQTNNPEAFAHALQKAGYATDPDYARKITSILNGDTLRTAATDLKVSSAQSFSTSPASP